jgi:hypothetical protein
VCAHVVELLGNGSPFDVRFGELHLLSDPTLFLTVHQSSSHHQIEYHYQLFVSYDLNGGGVDLYFSWIFESMYVFTVNVSCYQTIVISYNHQNDVDQHHQMLPSYLLETHPPPRTSTPRTMDECSIGIGYRLIRSRSGTSQVKPSQA